MWAHEIGTFQFLVSLQ